MAGRADHQGSTLSEQIGEVYQLFANTVVYQGGSRSVEQGPLDIKLQLLARIREEYDVLRINLGRKYGVKFPTLEETANDESSTADDADNGGNGKDRRGGSSKARA